MKAAVQRSLLMTLVLAFMSVAGCSSNKGVIEGKWESLEAKVEAGVLPAGAIVIEFLQDRQLVFSAGPQRISGTYVLGRGHRVKLNLSRNVGSAAKDIVIEGDRMTMKDGMSSVEFRRIR